MSAARQTPVSVYRVYATEDDGDVYNAPTKVGPMARAAMEAAGFGAATATPPRKVPKLYEEFEEDGDARLDALLGGAISTGTVVMPTASRFASPIPPASPLPLAPAAPSSSMKVHYAPVSISYGGGAVAEPSLHARPSAQPARGFALERLPPAVLIAIIVACLAVGVTGVTLFFFY